MSLEIQINNDIKQAMLNKQKDVLESLRAIKSAILLLKTGKDVSREEIEAEVKAIISEVGASSPKDMGRVMGQASKRFAGKADNRVVSEIVKSLLQN